jgi:hypothetical protein
VSGDPLDSWLDDAQDQYDRCQETPEHESEREWRDELERLEFLERTADVESDRVYPARRLVDGEAE